MRITITQDFDSAEAAAEFLTRFGNPTMLVNAARVDINRLREAIANASGTATSEPTPAALDKPGRKPRADAGQARGPYKPRATTELQAAQPTVALTDSGATPTTTAAPAAPVAQAHEAQRAEPAPPAAATLTDADARAALKRLNDAEGKGTEACLAALRVFGVVRISDVKPEQYADFIKHVLAQLPEEKK